MKKLLTLILAIILIFAFSACGSNADETATTAAKETTTEPTEAEYDLYQTLTLAPEELPIQFSAEVNNAIFRYVPYETRQENGFDFNSVLRVEVNCASQDLVITFPGSETVFPANTPEAVVYSNNQQHANANYEVDLGENFATMDGFGENIESVDIIFHARYMSTIYMPVGEELYEVSYLQVVFSK
ncbi:MAG: hypothetical protein E7310_07935 [Clostridiales bacterium]|nr:hypothetical protein [Clostridiales bacterium]